jgi:hypothetical protein
MWNPLSCNCSIPRETLTSSDVKQGCLIVALLHLPFYKSDSVAAIGNRPSRLRQTNSTPWRPYRHERPRPAGRPARLRGCHSPKGDSTRPRREKRRGVTRHGNNYWYNLLVGIWMSGDEHQTTWTADGAAGAQEAGTCARCGQESAASSLYIVCLLHRALSLVRYAPKQEP